MALPANHGSRVVLLSSPAPRSSPRSLRSFATRAGSIRSGSGSGSGSIGMWVGIWVRLGTQVQDLDSDFRIQDLDSGS